MGPWDILRERSWVSDISILRTHEWDHWTKMRAKTTPRGNSPCGKGRGGPSLELQLSSIAAVTTHGIWLRLETAGTAGAWSFSGIALFEALASESEHFGNYKVVWKNPPYPLFSYILFAFFLIYFLLHYIYIAIIIWSYQNNKRYYKKHSFGMKD